MIYLIESNGYLKIGYSDNIMKRLKAYETHSPNHSLLFLKKGQKEEEVYLHNKFKKFRYDKEWFYYNEEIIDYFEENAYYIGYSNSIESIENKFNDFVEKGVFNVSEKVFEIIAKNIKQLKAVKLLFLLMNNSKLDNKYGNCFDLSDNSLKKILTEHKFSTNTYRFLKELISINLIHRIDKSRYRLNPLYMFCGNEKIRIKLVRELRTKELKRIVDIIENGVK